MNSQTTLRKHGWWLIFPLVYGMYTKSTQAVQEPSIRLKVAITKNPTLMFMNY